MSGEAVAWAKKVEAGSLAKNAVLLVLADYASDKETEDYTCYVGQKRISKILGCGERTVRGALKDLEKAGIIYRETRYREDEFGKKWKTSDRIHLCMENTLPAGDAANLSGSKRQPQRQEIPKSAAGAAGQEPQEEPLVEPQDTVPSPTKAPPAEQKYPIRFERFWRNYPRTPNMSKKKAYAAWQRIRNGPDIEAMLDAVDAYKAWLAEQKDHPVAHAATWLSQARWEGFLELGKDNAARVARRELVVSGPDEWQVFLKTFSEKHGVDTANSWFGAAEYRGGDPPCVVFEKRFTRNWVLSHYEEDVRQAFPKVVLEVRA